MTMNNTQIPKEAIEGAASPDDKFAITALNFVEYLKITKAKEIPYTVVSNEIKKEVLSTELGEGMTIKAVLTQNRRRAAQKIEDFKNKDIEQGE